MFVHPEGSYVIFFISSKLQRYRIIYHYEFVSHVVKQFIETLEAKPALTQLETWSLMHLKNLDNGTVNYETDFIRDLHKVEFPDKPNKAKGKKKKAPETVVANVDFNFEDSYDLHAFANNLFKKNMQVLQLKFDVQMNTMRFKQLRIPSLTDIECCKMIEDEFK